MNLRALGLAALLLGGAQAGWAQSRALGPKDGAGLPPTDLERVALGDLAPDFTLEAFKGEPITLSDFRGKKNVVLVFYRGHW
jgi:cytochrome oxidase Cu insertion factor (SCO1/SenC/PrrC family)